MQVVPESLPCSEKEVYIKFAGLLLEGFCFIAGSSKQERQTANCYRNALF